MSRPLGPAPPAPDAKLPSGMRVAEYEIDVVTPLFGGGVEAGKNDPVTPIRGSEIRGHLRFWWRAIRGARYADVRELKQAEDEIWGNASTPSKVSISVDRVRAEAAQPCAVHERGKSFPRVLPDYPGYVVFPFVGNPKNSEPPGRATPRAAFVLHVSWQPSVDDHDVQAAVWAWTNFGGLGARVRRGCGALWCKELAPPLLRAEIPRWYEAKMAEFGGSSGDGVRAWPTLQTTADCLVIGEPGPPKIAWASAVHLLREFRQGLGVGRRRGSGKVPGSSLWPEPGAIRRLAGRQTSGAGPQAQAALAFPRAELGLPIIFHFKPRQRPPQEPPDVQLLPDGDRDRMSSPVITKPLCTKSGQAFPMVLRLRTHPLDDARLAFVDRGSGIIRKLETSDIRAPQAIEAGESPVKGRSSSGSALEAFMNYARQTWESKR